MAAPHRMRLTSTTIEAVPASAGVYVLYAPGGVVNYVGSAGDLRQRLGVHLREGSVPAVSFSFETRDTLRHARQREGELIRELDPRHNLVT